MQSPQRQKSRELEIRLTNEAVPGLVKIGYTTEELNARLQQLNTTGLPVPFQIAAFFYVREPEECENKVHAQLTQYRTNPKREFFSQPTAVLIKESIDVIGEYMESSPTPHEHVKLEEGFSPDEDDIYFMFYFVA